MHVDVDGESFMLESMKTRTTGLVVGSRAAVRGINNREIELNDLQLSDIHQQSEMSTGNSLIVGVGKAGSSMDHIIQPRSFAE